MEPSDKARKIIGRVLLWLMMFSLLIAGWEQFVSPWAATLADKKDEEIRLDVLTTPVMKVLYNPSNQKAYVTVTTKRCNPKLTKGSCLEGGAKAKFFRPEKENRDRFWESFKQVLGNWRFNPLYIFRAAWTYISAWHDGRTNLTPAEFVLLSMELSKLEVSDFAVKFPPSSKRNKKQAKPDTLAPVLEDLAPLAVKDRPLVVEVLNASGKKGLALTLTQYLRDQNEKGLLRVDVLEYGNYPTVEEKSSIVDYGGRLVQVKQLSQAIGLNGEIKSDSSTSVICETRIIIGKDFKMPL